jgi:hypothetical protein
MFRTAMWNALDAAAQATGDEPKRAGDWQNLLQNVSGELPGGSLGQTTPISQALYPLLAYSMGVNPYDGFRKQFMLTNDEMISKDTSYAWSKVGKNAWNSMLGSMIGRFDTSKINPLRDETPALVDLLRAPGVGPTLGRFLRVVRGGQQEQNRAEENAGPLADAAEARLAAAADYAEMSRDPQERIPARAVARMASGDIRYIEAFQNLRNNHLLFGNLPPDLRALVNPTSTDTRIQAAQRLLDQRKVDPPPEE